MAKYRKKPVVVEAVQWTGENFVEVGKFVDRFLIAECDPPDIFIETLEGRVHAAVGDYIIKGVNGEFYPCKPDIFEKTYEREEGDG